MAEEVILVNEQDEPVGRIEKMEAHKKALLHRAFSIFIFNAKGEMLLQQRSAHKYHSAGLWTNACCSHPRPGEDVLDAASRRLNEELGFSTRLKKIFDFIYQSSFDNGLTEYEFDHVLIGEYGGEIMPNTDEVSDYCYKSMEEIQSSMQLQPAKYTAWFNIAFPMIKKWMENNIYPEKMEAINNP
ncbi:MAG TPA: isopentenyl-diphosphate Delta-isomerase [Puia sp.]|nr:isopentenyl-diphosphate Delta-isomerase [Puia sp.]